MQGAAKSFVVESRMVTSSEGPPHAGSDDHKAASATVAEASVARMRATLAPTSGGTLHTYSLQDRAWLWAPLHACGGEPGAPCITARMPIGGGRHGYASMERLFVEVRP